MVYCTYMHDKSRTSRVGRQCCRCRLSIGSAVECIASEGQHGLRPAVHPQTQTRLKGTAEPVRRSRAILEVDRSSRRPRKTETRSCPTATRHPSEAVHSPVCSPTRKPNSFRGSPPDRSLLGLLPTPPQPRSELKNDETALEHSPPRPFLPPSSRVTQRYPGRLCADSGR